MLCKLAWESEFWTLYIVRYVQCTNLRRPDFCLIPLVVIKAKANIPGPKTHHITPLLRIFAHENFKFVCYPTLSVPSRALSFFLFSSGFKKNHRYGEHTVIHLFEYSKRFFISKNFRLFCFLLFCFHEFWFFFLPIDHLRRWRFLKSGTIAVFAGRR